MLRGERLSAKSAVRRPFGLLNIISLQHVLRNATLRITPMHPSSDDAIDRKPIAQPDQPRSEPEIIPPGAEFRPLPGGEAVFHTRSRTRTRILVTRLGPLGTAAVLLGAGVLGVFGLMMLLGTLLIGAAAAGTIMLVTLVARLLRALGRS
jgi:hypothetical protein